MVARPPINPDLDPDKVHSVEIFAATRRQDGKASNEDAFALGRGGVPYAALCDGSGNAQGVAKKALGIFERLVGEVGQEKINLFATWSGWLKVLDSALMGGPQSTFLAVAVLGDRVVGSCVGDSRLYRLAPDGGIEIVTEGASKHRLGSGQVEPWPIHLPLKPGDVLLLASDGAWTPLGLPALRRVWARASSLHFSEFPALLLDEAGKKGCADDMTVIVMR